MIFQFSPLILFSIFLQNTTIINISSELTSTQYIQFGVMLEMKDLCLNNKR